MIFYVGCHLPKRVFGLQLRGFPVCVSVNVLYTEGASGRICPFVPGNAPGEPGWLLDSGAFTELARHGRYTTEPGAYAETIRRIGRGFEPDAAVTQDYMCEPSMLARTGGTVAQHIAWTVERFDAIRAAGTGRVYLMPVLQGWRPADYAACLDAYGERIERGAWVGVGSVCKRQGRPAELLAVLRAIKDKRPDLRLHGFGVKLTSLQDPRVRTLLYSADSMAWSYAERRSGRDPNDVQAAMAFARKARGEERAALPLFDAA